MSPENCYFFLYKTQTYKTGNREIKSDMIANFRFMKNIKYALKTFLLSSKSLVSRHFNLENSRLHLKIKNSLNEERNHFIFSLKSL